MASKSSGHARVYNVTRGTLLASYVMIADSAVSRLIGLLGKSQLPRGEGLWLTSTNAIHTIGMLFPIDLVLLSSTATVVGLRTSVKPYSVVWPNLRARSILELPAQAIANSLTERGDVLQIEMLRERWRPADLVLT